MKAATAQKYQNRPTSWLKKKAQAVFNKWIRERDSQDGYFTCISCGQIKPAKGRSYHAGHFYPVGSFNALRFHENNCYGQCMQCNYFKSGNLIEYRENVIKRIGQKAFEDLVFKAALSKRKTKKWTRFELIEIIEKYK